MHQFGIRPLRPTPWSRIEFVREDAHGGRDHDAFDGEERRSLILPIETGPRERGISQPGQRDVVEDVVSGEAFGPAGKNTCDYFLTACIVIEEVGSETDG